MKRKTASILGNLLMGCGLVAMIGSIAVNLASHVFDMGWSELITNGSLFGLFIGAMVWLLGAKIGGRETVSDRYWWLKNHDDKYRRDKHRYL
ncbi:stress-induced protein YchH [Moellerella wisconsensis]|uniref:Putative membrane protein n=1 Tax=Moellerella wisconsensis ATCC 35017 TaxID=1354267 RepID=A0A0N1KJ03_9GAMM|nr:stress-induced protein YchH [Moellerella wisconsensis]KPD02916.1 putative membrane protein [Moellerella wisconsensis ATCC 35017]VFS53719.1 Protein of uncharacterised function (DUF2583) [Moellerella wisconsensis]